MTDSRWLEGRSLGESGGTGNRGRSELCSAQAGKDKSGAELADFAKYSEVCRRHGVPFVINDDVDAAFCAAVTEFMWVSQTGA